MVQRKGVIIGRQKYFFLHPPFIIDTMVNGDRIYIYACVRALCPSMQKNEKQDG